MLIKNIEISYTDPVELIRKSIHSEEEAEIPLSYTGSSKMIYIKDLKDSSGKVLFSNIEKTLEKAQNISLKVSKESFVGTVMRIKDLGPSIALDSSNYKDYLDITIKDLGDTGKTGYLFDNKIYEFAIAVKSKKDDYLFYKCWLQYKYIDYIPYIRKIYEGSSYSVGINDEGESKETYTCTLTDTVDKLVLDEVGGRIYKKPQD